MKKKSIVMGIVGILATTAMVGAFVVHKQERNNNVDVSKLPIYAMKADFIYDTEDINENIGIVDYVFCGEVVSEDGVTYEDVVVMEDEEGKAVEQGTPYTHYSVLVKENIKGELVKEETIKIAKHGGVTKDQKMILLFDEDCLPEVGKQYIFLAYAQEDGSLLISGPNSNVIVSEKEEEVIAKYKEATKHEEIPVVRERFTSHYEHGNEKERS